MRLRYKARKYEALKVYDYQELKYDPDLESLGEICIRFSRGQASALEKVKNRAEKYALSSSTSPGSIRTALLGVILMLPELWGSIIHPNLSQIRSLIIGGNVDTLKVEKTENGKRLFHVKFKNA